MYILSWIIGIAACNIGGVTILAFAGNGLGIKSAKHSADKIMKNKFAFARWARTRVLIIDEVSDEGRKTYCYFSVRELRLLHICMQQFILPLRVESSRSWITGVPRNVARPLDWFDDIANLHERIYQSLCSARDTQSPTTDRVSALFI